MATQYGNRRRNKQQVFASGAAREAADAKDKQPQARNPNETPDARKVSEFHQNDDLDTSARAHHHTLGPNPYQASPGDHKHDGTDSPLILEGVTIAAAPAAYTQAWATSINAALVKLGAKVG